MTIEDPLKKSIAKRMVEERIEIKEVQNKKKRFFDFQILLAISVLIALFFTIVRLLNIFSLIK